MATKSVDLGKKAETRKTQAWAARARRWAGQAIFNLIPFVIVGAFYWVQIQIGAQGDSPLTKFEIGLTIVFEIALVFIWSLFLES